MAYCIRCGGSIEPGKGRPADGLFAKGFVCDKCSSADAKSAAGCILLVLVLVVGAFLSFFAAYALKPVAETSGFNVARNALLAMDAVAVVVWFICRRTKRRNGPFIVRMLASLVGFLMLCFAAGASLATFVAGDLLESIWGI